MTESYAKLFLSGFALCLLGLDGSGQTKRQPIFVSPELLNVASILPNPPADHSQAAAADLAEVHRVQAKRTAADIAHNRVVCGVHLSGGYRGVQVGR
jgi:hypothetical protein